MQTVHNKMTLDVNTDKNTSLIIAKAEDRGSRFIDIEMCCAGEKIFIGDNDNPVLMAEDTVTGITIAAVNCNVNNGIIIAELNASILAVPGSLKCEIVVHSTDGSVLTSPAFFINVKARIDSTVVERESDFSVLTSALSDVASTSGRIDDLTNTLNNMTQSVSFEGAWNPEAQDGTIIINSAHYYRNGSCITITANITCGNDIGTSLTLGGLPAHAAYDHACQCVVVGSSQYANAIVFGNSVEIISSDSLNGAAIIVTATYVLNDE